MVWDSSQFLKYQFVIGEKIFGMVMDHYTRLDKINPLQSALLGALSDTVVEYEWLVYYKDINYWHICMYGCAYLRMNVFISLWYVLKHLMGLLEYHHCHMVHSIIIIFVSFLDHVMFVQLKHLSPQLAKIVKLVLC